MTEPEKLIPRHGGYRHLKSFQVAQLVYDVTSERVANAALSRLNLCCYSLDRQLETQAKAFVEDGGFTERLYRVRNETKQGGQVRPMNRRRPNTSP